MSSDAQKTVVALVAIAMVVAAVGIAYYSRSPETSVDSKVFDADSKVSELEKEVTELKTALEEAKKLPENKVRVNSVVNGSYSGEYDLSDRANIAILQLLANLRNDDKKNSVPNDVEEKEVKSAPPKSFQRTD
jgi:hypothetical protein